MPVIEQNVDVANGKIRRLTPITSGAAVVGSRVADAHPVVLWSRQANAIDPVEIRAETTIAAARRVASRRTLVFANANAMPGLIMPDDGAHWLARTSEKPDNPARDAVG